MVSNWTFTHLLKFQATSKALKNNNYSSIHAWILERSFPERTSKLDLLKPGIGHITHNNFTGHNRANQDWTRYRRWLVACDERVIDKRVDEGYDYEIPGGSLWLQDPWGGSVAKVWDRSCPEFLRSGACVKHRLYGWLDGYVHVSVGGFD